MLEMCRDEFESHKIYKVLARLPLVNERIRVALLKASEDEYRHYLFWRGVVGECKSSVSMLKILAFVAMFYLFGLTVLLKFLESKESMAIKIYGDVSWTGSGYEKELSRIIDDEERHEEEFAASISEARVRYISFITLGISDALVELTGIYTGALGAFENSVKAGLTGFLAGVAAAISMAIAAYSQAKHEAGKSPGYSALYTFIAYIATSILLALPYFLIQNLYTAFTIMLVLAIAIVAYMTFYASVLQKVNYLREFALTTALILGVSLLLYILGSTLRKFLGIEI